MPKALQLQPEDAPCMEHFAAYHSAHQKEVAPTCEWGPKEIDVYAYYAYAFGVTDARARGIRRLRDFAFLRGARIHLGATEHDALAEKLHQAAVADESAFSERAYKLRLRAVESHCASPNVLVGYEAAGRACVRPMERALDVYREGFTEGCMMNAQPSELAACKEAAEKSLSESTMP